MRVDIGVAFALSLFLGVGKCDGGTLPGKPILLNCRSPEKETFTCWWTPGSDGGLPTTHRLFYTKENSDGTFECPDYRSAGDGSCFFDRKHTSIWVSYWLNVTAFNAMGNTTSDTLEVDVVEIVQPSPPENVTVLMELLEGNPYLHVAWRPPAETDISSGWVTVTYQLRVKTAGQDKWEEYQSGKQAHFNIHSLHSGEEYAVQVRCKLDHGRWSGWSHVTSLRLPDYALKQRLLWTVFSVSAVVLTTAAMCILVVKRNEVKEWILPPIPGPKIRGFDSQPLQNRYSELVLYGLIHQGFPPPLAYRGHSEEYLVVSDNDHVPDLQQAQPRSRSLIVPGFFQLSRPTCEEGPAHGPAHGSQVLESKVSLGSRVPDHRSSTPEEDVNIGAQLLTEGPAGPDGPPGAWSTVPGGVKDAGYVGPEEAGKGKQALDVKLEYSMVSGVNRDNMVVLEKEKTSCWEVKHHPKDAVPGKKEKACLGLLDNGYVDSLP